MKLENEQLRGKNGKALHNMVKNKTDESILYYGKAIYEIIWIHNKMVTSTFQNKCYLS